MNELTKEELEYIKWLVKDYEGEYPNSVIKLPEKIQSMMDNYCEHEWYTNSYNYVLHCQKCGKTIKSDSQGKIINVNQ